jgi:hypothetical protein
MTPESRNSPLLANGFLTHVSATSWNMPIARQRFGNTRSRGNGQQTERRLTVRCGGLFDSPEVTMGGHVRTLSRKQQQLLHKDYESKYSVGGRFHVGVILRSVFVTSEDKTLVVQQGMARVVSSHDCELL